MGSVMRPGAVSQQETGQKRDKVSVMAEIREHAVFEGYSNPHVEGRT